MYSAYISNLRTWLLNGLVLLALSSQVMANTELELRDPDSASAVTLPAGWTIVADDSGLVGVSADKDAQLMLAVVDVSFEEAKQDVFKLLEQRGLDVEGLDFTEVVDRDELGGFTDLYRLRGAANGRKGRSWEFTAIIAATDSTVAVAVGRWSRTSNKWVIDSILDSVRVDVASIRGDGGFVLRDPRTGASLQLPEGWRTMANRDGLMAASPDRNGLILMMGTDGDFEKSVRQAGRVLSKRALDDLALDDFEILDPASPAYPEGFARAARAEGSGIDLVDDKVMQFEVYAIERPADMGGVLVLGAWKSTQQRTVVRTTLQSVHGFFEEQAE